MEIVDQLAVVRKHLTNMTTRERDILALESNTSMRTLYNIVHPDRKPSYETVFRVFSALEAKKEPAKAKVKK